LVAHFVLDGGGQSRELQNLKIRSLQPMRIALTCATLVASLSFAAPLPALAAAHYRLAAQNRPAKLGQYTPVALTDFGLAAGTLYDTAAKTDSAYYSAGRSFSDSDYCSALGDPGGTELNGISRDAALTYTVGVCAAQEYGYVYDQTANTTTEVKYPGAGLTRPYGVNASGMVVGEWDAGSTHGFSLAGGTYTSVDAPGADYTVALGVTDQDAIFGNYDVAPSAEYGFVLAATGLFTSINYPGSTTTLLAGMNSQNLAVGFYTNSTSEYAFAWQNGTFMVPPLKHATSSHATSVNDSGDVAGWYVDTSNTIYGFVWQTTTNKVIKIKAPTNTHDLVVNAINNTHAQITGTYFTTVGEIGFIGTCTGTDCF
jgi:hypothetical protein